VSDWHTRRLPEKYSYISPGGVAEIRLLIQRATGELTHVVVPSGKISRVGVLDTVSEFFYVIAGNGDLWCSNGRDSESIALRPGRCVWVPPGVSFQYRSSSEGPLTILLGVVPMWQPSYHHPGTVQGLWEPSLPGNSEPGLQRSSTDDEAIAAEQPWGVVDLPAVANYLAPDNSEIRLLHEEPRGGLAHCQLAPGQTTDPKYHIENVEEIWFCLEGQGELWRHDHGGEYDVVQLHHGVCVDIPTGTDFQFRCTGASPLQMILCTTPAWPGAHAAIDAQARFWG
jgi:mannose-6-phosphate isomerase-like protein (cupin superfamily)